MNEKQKKDFIEWLGLLYLDFDNESEHYRWVLTKEITEKLESYEKR